MVRVERGVVPSDQIEVVLVAAPGISARKDIILEEGWNGLNGRWTIWTSGTVTTARNGLYTYQLPGGFMEFRKRIGNNNSNPMEYFSRVPIPLHPRRYAPDVHLARRLIHLRLHPGPRAATVAGLYLGGGSAPIAGWVGIVSVVLSRCMYSSLSR